MIPFTVAEIDHLAACVVKASEPNPENGALLVKLARWRELQVKRDAVNARANAV